MRGAEASRRRFTSLAHRRYSMKHGNAKSVLMLKVVKIWYRFMCSIHESLPGSHIEFAVLVSRTGMHGFRVMHYAWPFSKAALQKSH